MEKRLFLIDAYAIIYRSYYAFIKQPRMNSKGENTSAIFGFINTLEELIRRENPTHLAVCFDPSGPTFRHEAYDLYKAQREETPEVIRWSVPWIKSIVEAYRIPILEVPGFEADDVIGTISVLGEQAGFDVYMMTPDKDCGQLVTDRVRMYRPKYGSYEFEVLGKAEINSKYALVNPRQMIDLLGLMGDSSDNIPGCPGIGEVTAKKLLAEFGSIDQLLSNSATLKGKLKEKIEENIDQIKFSQFLATIRTDVPITFDEEKLVRDAASMDELKRLFDRLEFKALLQRVEKSQPPINPASSQQITPTLFETPQQTKQQTKQQKKATDNGQLSMTWDEPNLFNQPMPNGATSVEPMHLPEQPGSEKTEPTSIGNYPLENAVNTSKGTDREPETILASLETVDHTYHILENEADLALFIPKLFAQKIVCLDTETTGIDPLRAELVGMSFCWKKGEAWYLPFSPDRKKTVHVLKGLSPFFENSAIMVVGQNIKFDLLVLMQYGVTVKGALFDTMIAHYLLQPELRHGMDYLAEIYLNYKTIHIEALIGPKGKNQLNMSQVPLETIAPYAAEDADITFQLYELLSKDIAAADLCFLSEQVEMPLVKVLADMEFQGVGIDADGLKQASVELSVTLSDLEKTIQEMAGQPFNVNSPKQTGEILFDILEIDKKAKKTKTGQYSTSEEVLENVKGKHPIVEKILEQRGIKKLLSTYIDALPALIHPESGKLHTSFNQAVTATGRLSSSNPNLQNIPIREALGRGIRKSFTSGTDAYFLSADYSQIELRLMAHLSNDPTMIEAFRQEQDIHTATAAKINHIDLEAVTTDLRRKAKTANFGIIYGISVFGLAERLGVSRGEAKSLIDGYFETYPGVKTYMEDVVSSARTNGWVETLYHRKRYLPDIHSQNAVVRGYAERNAINAPIQGTAADIIKIAMVNIHKAMQEQGLKSKMILQVHDELDFIVPKNELDAMLHLVKEKMESAASLLVPLRADIGYGANWLEAH